MPKGTVIVLSGDAKVQPGPAAGGRNRTGLWRLLGALLTAALRPAGLPYNIVAFLLGRVAIAGELAPFGLAFFAAVAQEEKGRAPAAAVWAIAGVLSVGRYPEAGMYFFVAAAYWLLAGRLTRLERKLQAVPLFLFSAVAVGGACLMMWREEPLYNFLLVLFDAALCVVLIYIFREALAAIAAQGSNRPVAGETVMCVVVLAAAAVAGLGELAVAGVSLRGTAGSIAVMALALGGGPGLGAAAGVAVGLVAGLSGGNTPLMISLYAVAGLLAAAFRSQGKLAVIAGFLLGAVIGVLTLGQSQQLVPALTEAALGAALFAVLPLAWLRGWSRSLRERSAGGDGRPEAPAADKLTRVADIFGGLAATLSQGMADETAQTREEDEARLLAAVGRICGPCRRRSACWDKAHGPTSSAMTAALSAAERGPLTAAGLPEPLRTVCERAGPLADTVNAVAQQNRLVSSWQKRLAGTRRLVAEQLRAVGAILGDLAGELHKGPAGRDLAAAFKARAAAAGCPLTGVWLEDAGRRTLTVTKKPCAGSRDCLSRLLPMAAALAGEKMLLSSECGDGLRGEPCRLTFRAAGRYQVRTGWASAAKAGVSGDSCAVLALPADQVALVLSDGMGSGRRAAGESAATVRFLERLLTAGFTVEVAVKTVNSLLLLRLPEESFTTVDMAVVDTSLGEVKFLKVGAAPSFIKRVGEVATIQTASLPVGILQQVELEPVKWLLAPGDIIVMVSDGVVDVPGRRLEREPWLVNYLRRLPEGEPREMAERILRQAREMAGQQLRDDMTVLVAHITEKPGLG